MERKYWKLGSSIEIEPEGIREVWDREETFDHRAFARAALARWGRPAAQPVAEGPTDQELLHLYQVATPCYSVEEYKRELDFARAVLARWGRPAAEPVPEPTDEALANFTAWFCRNYPGPDTLIHRPEWHAPKVFRAAADALARWGSPTPVPVAIPGEKYHEDMGPVTWWRLPVDEPPWVGTPNDSDWPGYHTHFTPAPTNPLNAHALPTPEATDD